MKILSLFIPLLVATSGLANEPVPAQAKTKPDWRYIYTYFDGGDATGLWLMGSDDGFIWHRVPSEDASNPGERFNPKVGPWKIFRDPSFAVGPDGRFHLVWTTGNSGFGYAWSDDITSWDPANARYISVDHGWIQGFPMRHTWAPEVRYDPESGMFNIITSIRFKGMGKNNPNTVELSGRIQEFLIQTPDWENFSDPAVVFPKAHEMSTIDGDVFPVPGGVIAFTKIEVRDRFLKDDKEPRGGIRILRGESIHGPWASPLSVDTPMLPSAPSASEGPNALGLGPMLVVYHDWGFSASASFDLDHWFEITNEMQRPSNWRHGSVRQVRTERFGTGGVRQEYWEGVAGSGPEIDPEVFASGGVVAPFALPTMEVRDWNQPHTAKSSTNERFHQRVRALLTPPETGEYRFWISGDDRAELWMNAEGEDPAGSRRIAVADATEFRQWDKSPEQSATVHLEAGKSYYLELRQRDAEGPDHASVGWLRPGQSGDKPSGLVPEWVLSSFE